MEAVIQISAELKPKFETLISYLEESQQVAASAFFTDLLVKLIAVKEEEHLLGLFMELSTTAFVGLEFDDFSAQLIDEILLHAQEVSATFAVDSSQTH
mgnify:FL=1